MDWSYREKMHGIAKNCASQANIHASARCKGVPDHIGIERQRRLQEKKKRPAGLPSHQGAR
ncbi:MAG: hypothetical protein MR761_10220 [Butyricicoccus porcorum]|nr:hypothetical protein [Butyricicoccus porcorum]